MKPSVEHSNMLSLAWKMVRPYLLELPTVFLEEHKLLKETRYVADYLTCVEIFIEYAAGVAINPQACDPHSGMSISSAICRTPRFAKIPEQRRLEEICTITTVLNCFLSLFSTREEAVKEEYRSLLSRVFDDYKKEKFYHASVHDLMFESYLDMIRYFDSLCEGFRFDAVLTKGILEIFCTMMPPVISRQCNSGIIMTPSFAYKGILPVFAAKENLSGRTNLVCSVPVNRCFAKIGEEVIYSNEAPAYIDFILEQLTKDLTKPVCGMLSGEGIFRMEGIFNSDIIRLDTLAPAKNIFTVTKSFKLSNNQINIFSYDNDREDYLLSVNFGSNPTTYYSVGEGLLAENKAPMDLEILSRFSLSKGGAVSELTEKENDLMDGLIRSIAPWLDM